MTEATPRRKSIRFKGYDYSTPGFYFVTICTAGRRCQLGRVVGEAVELAPAGVMVEQLWRDMPRYYPSVQLDTFVVLPNHVHGIIVLSGPPALPEVVRGFKSMSARATSRDRVDAGPFWQRGFYEHVVRDEFDLARIRDYIDANPIAWANDPNNPDRQPA